MPNFDEVKATTPGQEVRATIVYSDALKLVTEYSAAISRGGCVFSAKQPMEIGRKFVFAMSVAEQDLTLSVEGVVVRSVPDSQVPGQFEVAVQYTSTGENRAALDHLRELEA